MTKPRHQWGDARLVRAIEEDLAGVLYHLADRANENSIDKHGLLSKAEAAARGVVPRRPGGNGLTRCLDNRAGLSDYVFISFFKSVLMPKDEKIDRFRRPMILEIAPDILFLKGVEVRLGRGAYAERVRAIQAFYKMDWDIWDIPELRKSSFGPVRWNTFLSYEILVPKCVPRNYILGIAD